MTPAVLARLYKVTSAKGAQVVKHRSMNSALLATLPCGALFHGAGVGDGPWIKRLFVGGYVWALACEEVV